jgi:uncharacterized protein (UPF0254 family)
MLAIGVIAVAVVFVLTVAGFRALTRPPEVGPESSEAAKEYAEMKERQKNIAGFWSGFFPG